MTFEFALNANMGKLVLKINKHAVQSENLLTIARRFYILHGQILYFQNLKIGGFMRTMATLFMLGCFPISLFAGVLEFCPRADDMPGWKFEFEPEVYTPENLHDYIDGEAELYKKYGFVEMATVTYQNDKNPAVDFTIDIYDMGESLNAFGIYSTRRQPDMTFADIGDEATVSDLMIRFWKGRFYVQVVAGSVQGDRALLTTWAQQVAHLLPSAPQPQELSWLPQAGQIKGSSRYLIQAFAGLTSARIIEAEYQADSITDTAFVILCDSKAMAARQLETVKTKAIRVRRSGAVLYGVLGVDQQSAAALLRQFNIPPDVPHR